jgi:hypothetical protein
MVLSTLTVLNANDNGPGSLRDTITNAKSGDTIAFAPSLQGQTITLTSDQLTLNKSLDIEGPGANLLAISGNDQNRIFSVNEGLTVTIAGLTLTHGRGSGSAGGGIQNVDSLLTLRNDVLSYNQATAGGAVANRNGGSLTVTGCTFLGNQATGKSGIIGGGAIANTSDGSTLAVTDSTFIDNQAVANQAGGGAIEDIGGKGAGATINGCVFTGNRAIGTDGGVGGEVGSVYAGAIFSEGAGNTLSVTSTTFTANQALAGNGGSPGTSSGIYSVDRASGGAIEEDGGAILLVDHCGFSGNQAIGGSNATGGVGGLGLMAFGWGGAVCNLSVATITASSFDNNLAQGGSGNSDLDGSSRVGSGIGGAIANVPFYDGTGGILNVSASTFTNNQARGGTGNSGGPLSSDGIGGAVANQALLANRSGGTATFTNTTFAGNQAIGGQGSGGNGADGLGGGLASILGSTLTLSGCTLSGNQAAGGAGGAGGSGGSGFGGGLFNDGTSSLCVTGSTITNNAATGGGAGSGGSAGQGVGGGAYFAAGGTVCLDAFTLANIVGNTASTSNNDVFGTFTIC